MAAAVYVVDTQGYSTQLSPEQYDSLIVVLQYSTAIEQMYCLIYPGDFGIKARLREKYSVKVEGKNDNG